MRRAFVIGSNGPREYSPLRYALRDADAMRRALSAPRCAFDVEVPEPGSDAIAVRQHLYKITEACSSGDTLICYFSGHGVLEKGSLFLLLDDTQFDRLLSTAIAISEILQALRYCKARNKLLILDCCHAGAAVSQAGFKDAGETPIGELLNKPDNYVILMASDRLERARELDMLEGSFLTTSICVALSERFREADRDHDGRISLNDLTEWLEDQTAKHNRQFRTQSVPRPYQFGQQTGGGFYLTVNWQELLADEIEWPDGTTMVTLPFEVNGYGRICIGKHPVTNRQYRRFVESTGSHEPVGKTWHGKHGRWRGPFYPWRDPNFNDPDQPVTCVSYKDAIKYCEWVDSLRTIGDSSTRLPTPFEWELAAFGIFHPHYTPSLWLSRSAEVHHKVTAPARIDQTGARSNSWGISDMFGNVWEWCEGNSWLSSAYITLPDSRVEIRGGGFLDDLSEVMPVLTATQLRQRTDTRHADLGLRIAATLSKPRSETFLREFAARWFEEPFSFKRSNTS